MALGPAKIRTGRRKVVLVWVVVCLAMAIWPVNLGWEWYRAHREWTAAERAIQARDLATAATHLTNYEQLRPSDPAGWFLSARTARRLGHYAEAERHIEQCEQLGGETESTRLERDLLEVQQGNLGEVDSRLRATIDPSHADASIVLEALARGYVASDRWADARQACEMWRALQPDQPGPWLWSGLIAERQAQLEQASEFYRKAMEAAPDDRDPRAATARVLLRRRQSVLALEHFEWLLARQPNDQEAILGLAECRIELGRADEAFPLLERALARDPLSFSGLFLSGKAALERRDAISAEGFLRKAVRVEPGNPEALHSLVQSIRVQGKDAEAKVLEKQHEQLQRDLRRLGDLMRTITARLEDAAPCHEAGIIAIRVGRIKQGVNLLHEALRRTGDHRATHAALAAYYTRVGPADRADFHQRLADRP